MASVSALELVNRVRLFRRQPTTTDFATPVDTVTLNALNMAIEDILCTRNWEFDLRTDGQLTLRPTLSGGIFGTLGDMTLVTLSKTGLVSADVYGDYVVRMVAREKSDYANTAFRVMRAADVAGGTSIAQLDTEFPEVVLLADDDNAFVLHYNEYILPDTVREVVRASHQEDGLELKQVDPTVRYTEIYPDPYSTTGEPLSLAVGGFDIQTYEAISTPPTPGLRMAVWPIPDAKYVIDYSYYYRHPELVNPTDELVGVPTAVVNDIVWQATSTVAMSWDQNLAASHFGDLAQMQASAKYRAYGGNKSRRNRIQSFESGVGLTRREGFPGKVIG